jgi:hypothetical protein
VDGNKKRNFTQVQNALFMLYTQLPDFKADHALMYIVLMRYHNDEYGYAFPTQWELAHRLNCGENKPRQLRGVLKKYGLIDFKRSKVGDNDVYYVFHPIEDEAEFYAKFPQAKRNYEERDARFNARRKRGDDVDETVDKAVSGDELNDWL